VTLVRPRGVAIDAPRATEHDGGVGLPGERLYQDRRALLLAEQLIDGRHDVIRSDRVEAGDAERALLFFAEDTRRTRHLASEGNHMGSHRTPDRKRRNAGKYGHRRYAERRRQV